MTTLALNTFLSIIFSGGFALIAYQFGFLTESGFYGAMLVGFSVFFGLGLKGVLPLLFFFFTANFWSSWRKKNFSSRDISQVLANGGLPAIFALLFYVYQNELFFYLFLVSLGTMLSDTWSTEIGQLFSIIAYDLKTKRWKPAGFPGGISWFGIGGGFAGSFINASFAVYWKPILIIGIVSFAGNLIDSLIGNFLEFKGSDLESSGYRWINNNQTNFLSSLISVILFLGLYLTF